MFDLISTAIVLTGSSWCIYRLFISWSRLNLAEFEWPVLPRRAYSTTWNIPASPTGRSSSTMQRICWECKHAVIQPVNSNSIVDFLLNWSWTCSEELLFLLQLLEAPLPSSCPPLPSPPLSLMLVTGTWDSL